MRTLSTEEFIHELRSRDVKVSCDGNELRCSAPKGVLTPELRDELTRRKADILSLLAHGDLHADPPLLPIAREPPEGGRFPLSFAQERLWFLQQFYGDVSAYHLQMTLQLAYAPDVVPAALRDLMDRHAILRTRYDLQHEGPVQIVDALQTPPLSVVDLSGLSQNEYRIAAASHALEEARKPLDLAKGPVWHVLLIKQQQERFDLILTIHHIAADGWSMRLLEEELKELCRAHASHALPQLRALPIQYVDYAVWHRQTLNGQRLQQQLEYWKRRLDGIPPTIELPTDRPRPPVFTYRGCAFVASLNGPVVAHLRAFARRGQATLFMVLLAVFKVLLARYANQTDIVVGTPIAGRNHPDTEHIVGLFLNTLVLRTDLAGEPTFSEVLARVRDTTLGAYEHQDLPFERIVEAVQPVRDPSRNPLFQVMFTFLVPGAERRTTSRADEIESIDTTDAQVDLALYVLEHQDRIDLGLAYSADLFDADTMKRMLRHYERLLRSAAANPDGHMGRAPMLDEAELRQVLVDWNRTDVAYSEERRLHRLIEAQVDRSGEAVAVEFNDMSLTYGELEQRANQLSRYLRRIGVRPGRLVGVFMERSVEMVVALYGILKAGGAYVPLDPEYPPERIAFMAEDANVPVLLTQEHLRGRLPASETAVVCLDTQWEKIEKESDARPTDAATVEDLAYVIYTSGSTGRPKGVLNCHKGITNRLLWMQETYRLTVEDRVLQKTPFSFDVSVWEFFWPLMTGARLVVAKPGGHRDTAYLSSVIAEKKITTLHFVPSMLQAYLDQADVHAATNLRRVVVSGEALSYELQERFFQASGAELHNLYGPTEAAVDVTSWTCRRNDARRIVPIGRPIANTRIYILDRELQPVPVGVAGELHIAGVQVAKGYLNRPELTAERFVPDPYSDDQAARMYKTGDLARHLPDGNIEYLGRMDNQVKLRGFRIELGEIEAVLARHDGARAAVVAVREDTPGDQRLVAYVVADPDRAPTTEELRTHAGKSLPAYMVPSAFVFQDTLPLTPSGKIDRRALPAPPRASGRSANDAAAPNGELEQAMARIWQELLDIDQVHVSDMFFDLGGHSLLSIQAVQRFERETGVRIAPMDLVNQTLRQLVAGIEARRASADKPAKAGHAGILSGLIGSRS